MTGRRAAVCVSCEAGCARARRFGTQPETEGRDGVVGGLAGLSLDAGAFFVSKPGSAESDEVTIVESAGRTDRQI